MPVIYLGFVEYSGTSKKTNKPYQMRELHFADLASNSKRSDVTGHLGMLGKTMPIAPEAVDKFKDLKPLTAIELVLEADPERDFQTTRVSGYSAVSSSKVQA